MERKVVKSVAHARTDLGETPRRPPWLERQHALPFGDLSPDEFEVFSYILLVSEHPDDRIEYFGKTGDLGRDIVWVNAAGLVTLVQCKRFRGNVGIGEVRGELAKLFVNVFTGAIPVKPDRVVFYVAVDLTAPAKDLLNSQDEWVAVCDEAIREHLGKEPSNELKSFAREWWPSPSYQTGLQLTKRSSKFPDLTDEFFSTRKVIDASRKDIEDMFERWAPRDHSADKKILQDTIAILGDFVVWAKDFWFDKGHTHEQVVPPTNYFHFYQRVENRFANAELQVLQEKLMRACLRFDNISGIETFPIGGDRYCIPPEWREADPPRHERAVRAFTTAAEDVVAAYGDLVTTAKALLR